MLPSDSLVVQLAWMLGWLAESCRSFHSFTGVLPRIQPPSHASLDSSPLLPSLLSFHSPFFTALFIFFFSLLFSYRRHSSYPDYRTKPVLLPSDFFQPCPPSSHLPCNSLLPPFPRPVKLPSLHRLSSVYTVKCPALISVGKHCKFLLTRLPSRYHVKLAESNESIDHPLWWNRCISPSSSPSPSLTDPSSFLQNSGKIRENSRESLSNSFSSFVSRFRSECVHGHV